MNTSGDITERAWFRLLLVALLYFACGKAAFLLAVEPGFASPVWPAAGVGLAAVICSGARMALGVFLGSFTLNLWQSAGLPLGSSVPLAGGIALGAVVQALVGAGLCRRFVGAELALAQAGEVARFMLWGGAVGCLVSATWGVGCLVGAGALPWEHAMFNWFNWWVGDAIGVMIFTPLLLAFGFRGSRFWRRRRVTLLVPLAGTLALVAAMFGFAEEFGRERLASSFQKQASGFGRQLAARLESKADVLRGLGRGVEIAGDMDRADFRRLTQPFLAGHPDIQALDWLPIVTAEERAAFVARARSIWPDYRINKVMEGELLAADTHDRYVPCLFVEPEVLRDQVLGLDHWAVPARRAAMERARDSGEPAMTEPLDLLRIERNSPGMLVFYPVYGREMWELAEATLAERRAGLRGFVMSVLVVDKLVGGRADDSEFQGSDYAVEIHDESSGDRPRLLYRRGQVPDSLRAVRGEDFRLQRRIEFAGRTWTAQVAPGNEALFTDWAWQSWSVLMAGLLFACVLCCLLLVTTGRSLEIEREVEMKTTEARKAERELRDLAETLEERVKDRTEALKRSEAAALNMMEDSRIAERNAKDSEERFRSIIEAAPSAMIMVGRQGKITLVNSQAEELFGYRRDELLGQNIEMLVPERYRADHSALRAGFMQDAKSRVMGAGRDLYGLRRDGRETPIEIGLNPVRTAEGKAVLASIIDISERKEAQEFVLAKNRELESLLYIISHDLREPLRTIQNFTEIVGEDYGDRLDDEGRHLVSRILVASNRLERLLLDLLDVSRARRTVEPKSILPLQGLVVGAIEKLSARIAETEARIKIAEDLPLTRVDPTWAGEAILNLLSNAMKYTRPGEKPEIDIVAYAESDQVGLAVMDRGPGVAAEQRERIFELFQRGVGREVEGTGAGLAIVQEVALKHGGKAWVEDREGGGARFVTTFGKPAAGSDGAESGASADC